MLRNYYCAERPLKLKFSPGLFLVYCSCAGQSKVILVPAFISQKCLKFILDYLNVFDSFAVQFVVMEIALDLKEKGKVSSPYHLPGMQFT